MGYRGKGDYNPCGLRMSRNKAPNAKSIVLGGCRGHGSKYQIIENQGEKKMQSGMEIREYIGIIRDDYSPP